MGWLKKAGAWLWKNKGKVVEAVVIIYEAITPKKKKPKPEEPIDYTSDEEKL